MNILHVIEDYSAKSGGLRTVLSDLNSRLNTQDGVNSFVISSQKEDQDNIFLVSNSERNPWQYSRNWKVEIEALIKNKNVNIIHIHGVWMYPQFIAAKIALSNKIPFILSPHGMFEPWLWTKGRFKKTVYFNLIVRRLFTKASIIHSITDDENLNLKLLFQHTRLLSIPNLIEFENIKAWKRTVTTDYILYLGRLDEKKGIDMLIRSFAKLKINKKVHLKIAGGFNNYKLKLDQLINSLGIQKKVQFLGMVTGDEKKRLYKESLVFVAPSHSEVVGMVNLEAASMATPVITTFQTGLKRSWTSNGGILINPNEKELITALKKVLSWSKSQRDENGKKLYDFVKKEYSWELKLNDWLKLYSSVK